ncbi:coiled-coil domain-containing protein 153-like [Xenia sp. Carnegie-2017]|uniref:coiled-coil domain-containing protein 153-like n=1 Tax=Xenia sp. Carnegie-2017 TaxID=2897299 RepID=UPI001F04015E|nr:coiled-coil domain-containing protein 153-like [Xenia sp. Carnegie-2017]
MPPKKMNSGKRKKKKIIGKNTELTVEDKYKRTLKEIESLKAELAMRTEIVRRTRDKSARMEERMHEAQDEVKEEKQNKRDISTDLTRQYKMMQSELGLKIHVLEKTVTTLQSKLATTEIELKDAKKEIENILMEKDGIITELQLKIDTMESAYETLLHDTLDQMGDKIEETKMKWFTESKEILETNKQILLSYGLNPLEI